MTEASSDNRLDAPLAAAFAEVPADWRGLTDRFLASPAGCALCAFVDDRIAAGAVVYPRRVFRALELTPFAGVRVVILGQDPYHGAGQAQGLAFSVAPGVTPPPSLRNLLREVRDDTGGPAHCRDDLGAWARQGVLLLNSVLTVEDGRPQSHADMGWEILTDALFAAVAARDEPVAFLLWGAAAQKKRSLLAGRPHAVVASNHPSPLSASRPPVPFLGSRPFAQVNRFLVESGRGPPIRW